jgi:hypothetical protein
MPSKKQDPESLTARRVDLPCSMTGFSPPPYPVQIKFVENEDRWRLVALTAPGKPPQIARWLEQYKPVSIYIGTGISPRVLRANFDSLPGNWEDIVRSVNMQFAQLTPEGVASIFVEDTQPRVTKFLESVESDRPEVRARKAHMEAERVKLTPRQLEVLSIAVALGYYEVPHKLNLRELAAKLDLSVGAVSELLRRAEALIITSYVDSLSRDRWDAEESKAEAIKPVEPQGYFDSMGQIRQGV